MKLIVCSIGVLVVTGAISSAIAPVSSFAQPAYPSSLLDLSSFSPTTESADHLIPIDDQARSGLQAILTPTQRRQLETALEGDAGISRSTLTALNLSPVQQAELMQILMSNQLPSPDVLTPSQIEHVRRTLPFQL
ncbi:MAG: hypothetical protein KME45_08000 [Stenomitos rutilans HA7619-LM2]|jgi:hypothetical protein|nr:hypothetical protein [Stenomitos rutilans HA7619-LM2]